MKRYFRSDIQSITTRKGHTHRPEGDDHSIECAACDTELEAAGGKILPKFVEKTFDELEAAEKARSRDETVIRSMSEAIARVASDAASTIAH